MYRLTSAQRICLLCNHTITNEFLKPCMHTFCSNCLEKEGNDRCKICQATIKSSLKYNFS